MCNFDINTCKNTPDSVSGVFFPLQVVQIPICKHTENNGMPHPCFTLSLHEIVTLIMQHKIWLIFLMLHKKNPAVIFKL